MTAYIQRFLHQHQMELVEPLVEVKTAARLAQQLVYQNKVWHTPPPRTLCSRPAAGLDTPDWCSDTSPTRSAVPAHRAAQELLRLRQAASGGRAPQNMLQAGLIVAGWDKREGGSVYALPLGGTLIKVPFSIGERALQQPFGAARERAPLQWCHPAPLQAASGEPADSLSCHALQAARVRATSAAGATSGGGRR